MEDRDPLTAQPAPHAPTKADHERETRAEEICSRLLIERWVPKRAYRDLLLDDDLRASVGRRLGQVGLELVESFTSDWFAVRLKRAIEGDISFDWATNARLPRGSVALLVVLWAKLILPKRLEPADQATETPDPAAVVPPTVIARDQLYAEFGRKFGKTAFARYVGQLKAAGFVREDRSGNLREGPLLDLLVDGVQMAQKLRDSVLWDVLESGLGDVAEVADAAAESPDADEFAEEI